MTRIEDYDGLEVTDFIDAPTGDISSQSLSTEQVESTTTNTEELSVGTDGPATGFEDLGLLAEAGYSQGDVIPLYRTSFVGAKNAEGTSTSFANFPNVIDDVIPEWSSFIGETVVRGHVLSFAGLISGTHTAQFYNGLDDEGIINASRTDDNTGITTAWQSYTPPTTTKPLRVYLRCKKGSSGDNDYRVEKPMMEIGVRL